MNKPVEKNKWRSPTEKESKCMLFNAIWSAIKTWDVNVLEQYTGYCGANGNHVMKIMDAINSFGPIETREEYTKQQKIDKQMDLAIQKAAKAWCGEKTSGKIMDIELAVEFAKILVEDHKKIREDIIEDLKALKYKISPVEEKIQGANWFVKNRVNKKLDEALSIIQKEVNK